MRVSRLPAAAAAFCFLVGAGAAPPPDVWKNGPVDATSLQAQTAALDAAEPKLPAPVRPAVEFQKMLLHIRSGADPGAWRGDVEKWAKSAGSDSVTTTLRELAKYWQARLAMREIDRALHKYYGENIRFPDRLDEVKSAIPESVKNDPWGEAWSYKPTTSKVFSKLAKQRYELGPARFPNLSTIKEAVSAPQSTRTWKITPREVAGSRALEIRGSDGQAAVVQAGAKVGDVSLVFIGDGWALLADTERLFTVAF
jgi:type II secretory pathway pseudopilin PulG